MRTQATVLVGITLTSALLHGCGGGSGDSNSQPSSYNCASNPVAKNGVAFAEVAQTFGSKVIRGQFAQQGVGPGGGAILTMLADGTGGTFGSPLIFSVSSVCTSTSFANVYFLSGTWADGTTFLNVQFNSTTFAVTQFPMPAGWNGPNWYFRSSGI